ncbi:MAG: A/G-specific adenine glycosylase [Parcubacteria bacterium C7867-001]|nr:MAG: A/G-specific adenine glycosylase [Parcubacteria bacterium C7867-001]
MTIAAFRKRVLDFHAAQGRHALPWRESNDPYRVLVSEIMLQQTQVERVIPFYKAWIKKFPIVRSLAKAPLADVLKLWQGLGYNRRARLLLETAKAVVRENKGVFPKTPEELEKLPGIGPYTARAVAAFSYNQDVVFIETNIRTAVTHHFFPHKKKVEDKELIAILAKALPKGKSREWYSALMDYGSYLKRSGVRINAKAKGYTKQPKFEGSPRQARGAILKALVKGPQDEAFLIELLGSSRRVQMCAQLAVLTKEGMIELSRGKFRLPK